MQDFSHQQYYQSVASEDAYHSELPPHHLPTGPKELSSITAYDRFLRGHLSSCSLRWGQRFVAAGLGLEFRGIGFDIHPSLFSTFICIYQFKKTNNSWKDQLEAMKLANYIWLRKKHDKLVWFHLRWHPAAGWKQVQCSKAWFVELLNLDGLTWLNCKVAWIHDFQQLWPMKYIYVYMYIYICIYICIYIYMCILYCTIHRSYRYFLLNMLLCVSVCNIAYIQLALQLETNFVIEWIGESLTTFKTELFKQNTKNSVTASQKAYRLNHVPPIFLHHPTARRLTQVIPIIIHQPGYFSVVPRFLFRQKKIHSLGGPNLWRSLGPNQRCLPYG